MAIDLDFERTLYSTRTAAAAPAEDDLFTTYAERVLRRVDEALAGRDVPWAPAEKQKAMLRLLRDHQGAGRSVPLEDFARRLGIAPREVKEIVQQLRLNFRVQVGASRDARSGGYFLIASEAESRDATTPMIHQAVSMLRTVHAMRSHHTVAELLGQVRLELEKENPHA